MTNGVTNSQTAQDITRVTFSGKDWGTYMTEMNALMQARWSPELYNNFVADDVGQMMLEAVAYGLSTLSWFMDRQGSESYLETAEIPFNVARLARLVGYKPSGAVPSSGNVEITLDEAQIFDVVIQRLTQLVGPSGKIYETSDKLTFLAGEVGPKTVGVVEGKTLEEVFTSDGTAAQIFPLTRLEVDRFVAEGSANPSVDGVDWPVVDFIDYERTNQVEISYTGVPPLVVFGDGDAGNIPPDGSEIRVPYRATLGASGVAPANTITAFQQPVVANAQAIAATVNNPLPTGAGSDPEALTKTKTLAPLNVRTANRAVTDGDYQYLIESFSDPTYGLVSVGRAVVARSIEEDAETRSILQDLESQYGAVAPDLLARLEAHWTDVLSANCKANLVAAQILQADADGRLIAPNAGLASALKAYLEERKEVTQSVSVTDGSVNLFSVDTSAGVKVEAGYNTTSVLASVKAAIDDFLTAKGFGESVYRSQLDEIVMALDGVDYVNLVFTEPSAKIDAAGNVVIETYEVVTLGTTTMSSIA